MKKIILLGAMVCALEIMTACKSGIYFANATFYNNNVDSVDFSFIENQVS